MNIKLYFNEEAAKHDDLFVKNLGMEEFYDEIERQFEKCDKKKNILVLGCGTGLEIERIKFSANVTAVDIADKMLEELMKKPLHKELKLKSICESLLEFDYGNQSYDIVVSCYVMHHFNDVQKLEIYRKIYECLTEEGVFIHGDTMVNNYEDEQRIMEQAIKDYEVRNLPFASLHIDVPFCLEHELEVLHKAGDWQIQIEREWFKTKLYRATKMNCQ